MLCLGITAARSGAECYMLVVVAWRWVEMQIEMLVNSSLVNTPQIQRNTPVQYSSRKRVTFRTTLTGLSVLVA